MQIPSFRRPIGLALLGFALTAGAASSAFAGQSPTEQQVTVLMRNGNRVSGQLEGVGNNLVYVRASLAEQHKIPQSDVLVIDLVDGASGLPETETADARGAAHLLVLRDSSKVKGRLIETRGGKGSGDEAEPRLVYFEPEGASSAQRYPAERVGRIYLGNYPAAASEAPSQAMPSDIPSGAIRIAADQVWTQTPVVVRRGERLSFSASGQIVLSPDAADIAGPAGAQSGRKAPGAPLRDHPAGCLMARVGNGPAFVIGDNTAPITMPSAGVLYLGVNDDGPNDNKGEFLVTIARAGGRR